MRSALAFGPEHTAALARFEAAVDARVADAEHAFQSTGRLNPPETSADGPTLVELGLRIDASTGSHVLALPPGMRKVTSEQYAAEGLEDEECCVCHTPELEQVVPWLFRGSHGADDERGELNVCCECAMAPRWSGKASNWRVSSQVSATVEALRTAIEAVEAIEAIEAIEAVTPAGGSGGSAGGGSDGAGSGDDALPVAPAAEVVETQPSLASTQTIIPIALSDADFMPEELFGRFENDHEGKLSYVCVAEKWVLLVGAKVGSC